MMQEDATTTEASEQEVGATFIPIDKLQAQGINVTDITRLKESGIHTVSSLLNMTTKELLGIKGYSDAKVTKVIAAAKKLVPRGFQSGTEALAKRSNVYKLTTGSKALDELLGGGVESGAITEVFGEFRTGKTQLCLTLCVTSQLPRSAGGGDGKVIYVDTEGTFRPERIQAIAMRFNMDPEAVLENIIWGRAFTHEEQMEFVHQAAAKIVEDESSFRVLIIDSVTALFRTDFSGRGELADRQQKLNKHLSSLKKLAEEFNIAVVLVNQVTADPGGASMFAGDIKKPIGGHVMAHASTTRLYFRKGKDTLRVCQVYDSPLLAQAEATFQLTAGGIDDE